MDGKTPDSFEGRLQRLELLSMNTRTMALFDSEYVDLFKALQNDLREADNIHDVEVVLQNGNQLQALLMKQIAWAKRTFPLQYAEALKGYHQTAGLLQ